MSVTSKILSEVEAVVEAAVEVEEDLMTGTEGTTETRDLHMRTADLTMMLAGLTPKVNS